jgi:DNA-binding transcriptional ArsR family regulator
MYNVPDISSLAALIADPGRAAMLTALLGGIALPAGELADCARVAPSTASAHLEKLVTGGLLQVMRSGRHRYYRLNGAPVAQLLETMALVAPPARERSLKQSLQDKALQQGRTCYDHLAGRLGIGLASALLARHWIEEIDDTFRVTPPGEAGFSSFGIDCQHLRASRRHFVLACLDWSERRPHLAGSLGAALTRRLFDLGWIQQTNGSRIVKVTPAGRDGLQNTLGMDWTETRG